MQECFNKYSAAVIITGRVHPGESPSSWIMRGTTTGCPKKNWDLWKIVTEGHWVELE